MASGTLATKTIETLERELRNRVPNIDPFTWYMFKQLSREDQVDLIKRCQGIAIEVDRIGIVGAFEIAFSGTLYLALHREKPWVEHDLRAFTNNKKKRNEILKRKNGGSKK